MHYLYLSLFLFLLLGTELIAQKAGDSPQYSLNAVFEKGNLMAALSGQGWRPGLNLAAAHLSVGQTISLNITLRKGIDYVFIASGPSEQTDVDLYLRDVAGKVLAEDQQDDGTPVLEFTAPANGTFQLQLHLAAGETPEAYVALSLLRRRGRQISEQNFRRVSSGFFGAAKEIRSSVNGTDWQKKAGEWCLFGYVVRKKEGVTLRGLRPALGENIFAAATGPKPSKITLYLATKAGRIVAGTEGPAAYPVLKYNSLPGAALDLRVEAKRFKRSKRSRLPALVLIGVFHH